MLMSELTWKMKKHDFYVDACVTVVFLFSVNFAIFYQILSEVSGEGVYESRGRKIIFFTCSVFFEVLIYYLLVSYRVIEINKSIILGSIFRKSVVLDKSSVESVESILRAFFVLKDKKGKKYYLFNHMGGSEELKKILG